jgi:hypothetical protein
LAGVLQPLKELLSRACRHVRCDAFGAYTSRLGIDRKEGIGVPCGADE